MAWAKVQFAPGGTAGSDCGANGGGSNISQSTGAFPSPVTIGNLVVIWAWGGGATAPTVTGGDNGSTPNTYTRIAFFYDTVNTGWAGIFVGQVTHNPASGNLNPKATIAGNSSLMCCAAEFSGGTTTLDGTAKTATGSTGAPAPGNLTTSVANSLVLAAMINGSSSATTTITTPTGFTHAGSEKNGSSFNVGEGIYQIASGTGTFNPAWNNLSVPWTAVQVALQAPTSTVTFPWGQWFPDYPPRTRLQVVPY